MAIVRGIFPIPGALVAEYSTGHPGAWLGIGLVAGSGVQVEVLPSREHGMSSFLLSALD